MTSSRGRDRGNGYRIKYICELTLAPVEKVEKGSGIEVMWHLVYVCVCVQYGAGASLTYGRRK